MHAELHWFVGFLWRLDSVRRESKTASPRFFENPSVKIKDSTKEKNLPDQLW